MVSVEMSSFTVIVGALVVVVGFYGVVSSPTLHRDLDHVVTTLAMPRNTELMNIGLASVSNVTVTENVENEITTTPTTEVEEGRSRKKKYKKLYHHFWNILYYYAWFVGIIVIKFKAVLLFLLGNLTFFVIALIRVLIKEVPMWNYLKKSPPNPAPIYGPPQYKYGPPTSNYGPPSPTYGTPSSSYDNSYSPVGLYKRQGADTLSGNDGTNAHDLAYSGQRE